MIDLKPCRICGKQPKTHRNFQSENPYAYWCSDENHWVSGYHQESQAKAAEWWNKAQEKWDIVSDGRLLRMAPTTQISVTMHNRDEKYTG